MSSLSLRILPAVALLFSASATAQAQADDDERARIHFQSGRVHYDNGDYEAALREFTAAYELSERGELLYNISNSHERLGHFTEAANSLEQFLASGSAPEDQRGSLESRVANLRRRAEAESVGTPDPGPSPGPEPEPAPDDDGGGGVPLPSIIAFAAGGVGLVMFGAFGAATLAEDSSLAGECGADAGRTCTEADLGTLHTFSALADVGWILALAGAATGLVLLFVLGGDDEEAPATQVSATILPEGGAAAVISGVL